MAHFGSALDDRPESGMPPAPDGLDLVCSGLSTPIAKNIPVPLLPKSPAYPRPSRPTQGAYRDRHGRGMGCGGRGLRQACKWVAGRIDLRERILSTQDDG